MALMPGRDTIPVMTAFLVINFITIALRIYARLGRDVTIGYDDAAIVVAYLGYAVFCSFVYVAFHYGYAATDVQPHYKPMVAIKFFTISMTLYIASLYLVKLSVGLVLYRIAETAKKVRIAILVILAISGVWSVAISGIFLSQCRPLSFIWGGTTEGVCLPPAVLVKAAYALSVMDILTGLIFALLPIYLLWGVKLRWRVKVPVIILLALGIGSNVATIIRFKYLIVIANATSATVPEVMALYASSMVFTALELSLTIFTVSLVALRPLLQKIPFFGSSAKSSNRLGPSHDISNGKQRSGLQTIGSGAPERAIRLARMQRGHGEDSDSDDGVSGSKGRSSSSSSRGNGAGVIVNGGHGRLPGQSLTRANESQEDMLHDLGKDGVMVNTHVQVDMEDQPEKRY